MNEKMLSNNLSYREGVKSYIAIQKGIKNIPNDKQLQNMIAWAEAIFQPIREHFKTPIGLNSMFRSKALNEAVGGSKSSQHVKGQAGDLDADIYGGITNRDIYEFVRDNLVFDQMIIYNSKESPDFVHISYKKSGGNRGEIFFKDPTGYYLIDNQ